MKIFHNYGINKNSTRRETLDQNVNSCNSDCNNCSMSCSERQNTVRLNAASSIKKIIGVVSGKGGVGKSLITSLLAVSMKRKGYSVGILDADVTGPSIPKMFGIKDKALVTELGIIPSVTKTGIETISINLLLENETDPVVWRGPVIAGMVTQLYTEVIWRNIDYLFVDMPPGTGDVPLTVFQSLPIDGIIVVSSPSQLVAMIVEKAIKMAELMNIPILGLIENMSYFICDECNKEHKLFGSNDLSEVARNNATKIIGRIPIDPKLSAAGDEGFIELFEGNWLDEAVKVIEAV